MDLVTVLDTVKASRDREDTLRDILYDASKEFNSGELQVLFEAAFPDALLGLSTEGRNALFDYAYNTEEPILSVFNEYVEYVNLAELVKESEGGDALEESPLADDLVGGIPSLYAVLRKNKNLSNDGLRVALEHAFASEVLPLDVEARTFLFELAADRGLNAIEIANAYRDLLDLVARLDFDE